MDITLTIFLGYSLLHGFGLTAALDLRFTPSVPVAGTDKLSISCNDTDIGGKIYSVSFIKNEKTLVNTDKSETTWVDKNIRKRARVIDTNFTKSNVQATLQLKPVQAQDGGTYQCSVQSSFGSVFSASKNLSVKVLPRPTPRPKKRETKSSGADMVKINMVLVSVLMWMKL